jgi:high-affinity nickel-transport protein
LSLKFIGRIFDDKPEAFRVKLSVIYGFLAALNIGTWFVAVAVFRDYPVLLGTGMLAYTFGLRHAMDADHIAAIDNVTRKLVQIGKRPLGVGLFFSLGHSTVVVIASLFVAVAFGAVQTRFEGFKGPGSVIGSGVSALFLLVVAASNVVILISVTRMFNAARRGEDVIENDLDNLLSQRGFLGRALRSLFKMISKSWHMYPLGILFGMGFDTATEIGLLGISAAQSTHGLPLWSILIFPALFTAAMSLVDTSDGILMIGAYGWAFVKPIRKLYYNMTMTSVSVIVAVIVGAVEALGLLATELSLDGSFWSAVSALNKDFGLLGYLIVGIFVGCWTISVLTYRFSRLDEINLRIVQPH